MRMLSLLVALAALILLGAVPGDDGKNVVLGVAADHIKDKLK